MTNPTLPHLQIVARFAERDWRNQPVKNFQQHCELVYALADGSVPTKGDSLASVNRVRKTRRSVWALEVRLIRSTSWMTPDDFRAYFNAIADAALSVEWPAEEINP